MATHHHNHHDHHHHQLLDEKSCRENNTNIMVSSSSSSFCYSDVSHHHLGVTHLQNFDSNPEIYNLASGIEMIGFQPKPQNTTTHDDDYQSHHNLMVQLSSQDQHHVSNQHQQEMGFMDDTSIRSCVFPCEGNERPSQGLSLSLSSSNPSTISLQSFELRHHHNQNHQRFNLSSPSSNPRHGFLGKSQAFHHQELFGKSIMGCDGSSSNTNSNSNSMSLQFELMRNSKYMGPTQELLYEFCNLGTQLNSNNPQNKKAQLRKNKEQWELEGVEDDNRNTNNNNNNNNIASSSTSSTNASLYGMSLLDLQKRKTKLLGMLEELDRRYKHYCEQMKGVVSSFEEVAGLGSANVYSALASKAMSRHFRCLRDTIVAQIKATKKAMGDSKDSSNATMLGTTKGETPRLRILDQNLRQQKAYQQMTMMEAHPWRPQRGLPERSVSILRAWLFEHFLHPYPSDVDKHILARQTGLSRSQVSNWFINARVRLWKPMVEQMYLEETKEEQDNINMGSTSPDNTTDNQPFGSGYIQQPLDQKPDPNQPLDSLSSIVNTTTNNTTTNSGQFIGRVDGFGSMDHHLDFQQHHAGGYGPTSQNDNNAPQVGFGGGNGGGNNVSLTLGLQQHGGNNNGVSLAFSPATQTNSLFYPRDHIEDCQQVQQYSLLDEDQGQNLPYRNLMGAQVLHDFA